MARYIELDPLVAWAKETYLCEKAGMIRKICFKQLLEHLNTIKVKEVDLESKVKEVDLESKVKEVDLESLVKDFCYEYDDRKEKWYELCPNDRKLLYNPTWANFAMSIARHFFELGLKAQKGE